MVLFPLLLALAASGQVWSVDDDGPADFVEIADAIASPMVLPGDTLLVQKGTYASFTLDKPLRLIAPEGERFKTTDCTVRDVRGFTIAEMRCSHLSVHDVFGRGLLDDVYVRDGKNLQSFCNYPYIGYETSWAYFADCEQLVVKDSEIWGSDGCYSNWDSTVTGIRIHRSRVVLEGCVVYGGDDGVDCEQPSGGTTPAIWAYEDSHVTLTGCDLYGGDTYYFTYPPGSPAVVLESSSLVVRGSSGHTLRGGKGLRQSRATAIAAWNDPMNSSARVSGVTLEPATLPPWVVVPATPEPYTTAELSLVDGTLTVELFGAPGTNARVPSSFFPDLLILSPNLDPFWFDVTRLYAVWALLPLGQDVPATHVATIPAAMTAGDAIWIQSYFPGKPWQQRFVTNVSVGVLRW